MRCFLCLSKTGDSSANRVCFSGCIGVDADFVSPLHTAGAERPSSIRCFRHLRTWIDSADRSGAFRLYSVFVCQHNGFNPTHSSDAHHFDSAGNCAFGFIRHSSKYRIQSGREPRRAAFMGNKYPRKRQRRIRRKGRTNCFFPGHRLLSALRKETDWAALTPAAAHLVAYGVSIGLSRL